MAAHSWGQLKARSDLLKEIMQIRTELMEVERDLKSGTILSDDLREAMRQKAEVLQNTLKTLEQQANL